MGGSTRPLSRGAPNTHIHMLALALDDNQTGLLWYCPSVLMVGSSIGEGPGDGVWREGPARRAAPKRHTPLHTWQTGPPGPYLRHQSPTRLPLIRAEGDEILVLTVQLDPRTSSASSGGGVPPGQDGSNSPPGAWDHRDLTTVVDDEQRLYFRVRPEGTGPPLPDGTRAPVYRRLLFSEPAVRRAAVGRVCGGGMGSIYIHDWLRM